MWRCLNKLFFYSQQTYIVTSWQNKNDRKWNEDTHRITKSLFIVNQKWYNRHCLVIRNLSIFESLNIKSFFKEIRTTVYYMLVTCQAPLHVLFYLILKTTQRRRIISDILAEENRAQRLLSIWSIGTQREMTKPGFKS